jgi:hypothetical protein
LLPSTLLLEWTWHSCASTLIFVLIISWGWHFDNHISMKSQTFLSGWKLSPSKENQLLWEAHKQEYTKSGVGTNENTLERHTLCFDDDACWFLKPWWKILEKVQGLPIFSYTVSSFVVATSVDWLALICFIGSLEK